MVLSKRRHCRPKYTHSIPSGRKKRVYDRSNLPGTTISLSNKSILTLVSNIFNASSALAVVNTVYPSPVYNSFARSLNASSSSTIKIVSFPLGYSISIICTELKLTVSSRCGTNKVKVESSLMTKLIPYR